MGGITLYGLISELLEEALEELISGDATSSFFNELTKKELEAVAIDIRRELDQLFGLGLIASIEGHIKQDILQRISQNETQLKAHESLNDVIDSTLIVKQLKSLVKYKFVDLLDSLKHAYESASDLKGHVESRNWIAHGKYFEANLPNPNYQYAKLKDAALNFATEWDIANGQQSKFFKA